MSTPDSSPILQKGDRIPYLDGLRGYSIFTVLVLHIVARSHVPAWLTPLNLLFGNGALGVDIFFVISGFLITTLLLEESNRTGSISLPAFYKRRIARIFPASYTYVLTIAILNLAGILHVAWRTFLPVSLFCWNYSDLLSMPPDDNARAAFNHFWSLSLEEQFYLFWPSCLVLMSRKNARTTAWVIVTILPVLRFGSYMLFPKSRGQLGSMFHTSADLVLWGTLVAFAYMDGAHLRWAKKRWLGWATLAYGITAIFVISSVTVFVPGLGRFLVPTVYTSFAALLLMWLLGGQTGVLRALLEWKPLRWVGVVSYSLYIWQQVFLVVDLRCAPVFLSTRPWRSLQHASATT